MQLEPGSEEGTISLAQYRIRSSVQAEMEKLWTERMEKEDKIMLNKHETLNSTVDPLGSEIINFQALLTNILQRHWEWQEDRRTDLEPGCYRYNTAFVASLDVPPCVLLVVFPSVCVFGFTCSSTHSRVVFFVELVGRPEECLASWLIRT